MNCDFCGEVIPDKEVLREAAAINGRKSKRKGQQDALGSVLEAERQA